MNLSVFEKDENLLGERKGIFTIFSAMNFFEQI